MTANHPLVVRLMGGLGNQLFQYATGRAAADRLGCDLVLDPRFVQARNQHGGLTISRLKVRACLANTATLESFPEWAWKLTRALRRVRRPMLGIWHERDLGYDEALAGIQPGQMLSGFWQSWRYFAESLESLRIECAPRSPLSAAARTLMESITDSSGGDAVAIHVRRGDYARNSDALRRHGLCSPGYYRTGLELIRVKAKRTRLFVFSDDIDWVRKHLILDSPVEFVSRPEIPPEEDLALMTACRHQLIANSTFGWWGAWLNTHPQRIVVAPSPWFEAVGLDSIDRFPPKWCLLDRSLALNA